MYQPEDEPESSFPPQMDSSNDSNTTRTRKYQQELLDESLRRNIVIALYTGAGKTHIATLRMKIEADKEPHKISWFIAPTVPLCRQQRASIASAIPVNVGFISGEVAPDQWSNKELWHKVLISHRIMVSTPQVLLDALRNGYIMLGRDINLLVFDEAHHAADNHPYNRIMLEHYFALPLRSQLTRHSVESIISPGVNVDLVRPMILGLTASPSFGTNVQKAIDTIEKNLDCTIRSSKFNRDELAEHVHLPRFRHLSFEALDGMEAPDYSTNLVSLSGVIRGLDILEDPYVRSLYTQLGKTTPGTADHIRIDQKISKTIFNRDTFTHKGLEDVKRTATLLSVDFGAWAADWYVWEAIQAAKSSASDPFGKRRTTRWKKEEERYLVEVLKRVHLNPVSYLPADMEEDLSPKVLTLIDCLVQEKLDAEEENEVYSGLVFVTSRVGALVLYTILANHTLTKDTFRLGFLLGTSDSHKRNNTLLDITRIFMKGHDQDEILMDFRLGHKNLIVSTSVAEEGIDIQSCGSVVRWDPPQNMVSWAQSRGRARKKKSSFTLLLEKGSISNIQTWERLEKEMIDTYNDSSRDVVQSEGVDSDDEVEEDPQQFVVESTGASVNTHSAIPKLNHFCAVIPASVHADNSPIYEIDPPDFPLRWHEDPVKPCHTYKGPFGARLTLPRCLPIPKREFSVDRIYKRKVSAFRHVAFEAYLYLYGVNLLDDHLQPLKSILEPDLEDEVQEALKAVEQRQGMSTVSAQINPWMPSDDQDRWLMSNLCIGDLPPLRIFTRCLPPNWDNESNSPTLFRKGHDPISVSLLPLPESVIDASVIDKARAFTLGCFWPMYANRMNREDTDFCYLFDCIHPADCTDIWQGRKEWAAQYNSQFPNSDPSLVIAQAFGKQYNYPPDIVLVKDGFKNAKAYRFVRWQFDPLPDDEMTLIEQKYNRRVKDGTFVLKYPLIVAEVLPPRTNFLVPITPTKPGSKPSGNALKTVYLPADQSAVALISQQELDYATLLPSVLRALAMSTTVELFVRTNWAERPLANIDRSVLLTALTAPVSGEKFNYQRLEGLGDAVLKLVSSLQLLAEYPLWHEGYLTKKQNHCVANVRLAKCSVNMGFYKWIIRDRLIGRKWKPSTFATLSGEVPTETNIKESAGTSDVKKGKKNSEELSTKLLADVLEALIGAAYYHGSFEFAVEFCRTFNIGIPMMHLETRVQMLLPSEELNDEAPEQIKLVEEMLGYEFRYKSLIAEALTHNSWSGSEDILPSSRNIGSYERLEYLGDAVLDMIVIDYVYRAPGKNYSPGHMFLRKAAVVNAQFLAYICLKTCTQVEGEMPSMKDDGSGEIVINDDSKLVYLWQCMYHSSHHILEDLRSTSGRFSRNSSVLDEALSSGSVFPWAELLTLQAPKFLSDIVESIIGAIYLDSGGSLDTVRTVLRKLGWMGALERIVEENVDVLHPVSRLSLFAQRKKKKITYDITQERGETICVIKLDGETVLTETGGDGSDRRLSKDEVKLAAAEKAIKELHLREKAVPSVNN